MFTAYQDYVNHCDTTLNQFHSKYSFWAFSKEDFITGMHRLGLAETDYKNIVRIDNCGFMLKDKFEEYKTMHKALDQLLKDSIAGDKTGNDFIYSMFNCELSNYEYCITGDPLPAIYALHLTMDEIKANLVLLRAFNKAIKNQAKGW